MSLVAARVLEASDRGEKNQVSNGGSLHPGQMVCEPEAMIPMGFGETTSILFRNN